MSAHAADRANLENRRIVAPAAAVSTYRLGFWSSVWTAVAAVSFPVAVLAAAIAGVEQARWTGDVSAYAASFRSLPLVLPVVASLLIAPGFVGAAVAVHMAAKPDRRPLSLLAVALATAYLTTVGVNYVIQLTAVRLNLEAGTTEGLTPLIMDNPRSVFYGLEGIGYLWQALALALLGAAIGGSPAERWIRRLCVVVVISAGLGVVALLAGLDFMHPLMLTGMAMWGVGFPVAMVLWAALFRRWLRESRSPAAPDAGPVRVP